MKICFRANLSLQKLAKLLAASFGLDNCNNSALTAKKAIRALHCDKFFYALPEDILKIGSSDPPPNLAFLEILTEFANKLPKEDRRSVLNDIHARCRQNDIHMPSMDIPSSRVEEWQSLVLYHNSLENEEIDLPQATGQEAD